MLLSLTSVSHEYWKELATRYAHHLAGTSSEQCIPYLLAVEKDTEAVEFYLQRRDITSAFAVAKMSEARKESHAACGDCALSNGVIEGESNVEIGAGSGTEAECEATYSLSGFMKAINMEETRKTPTKKIEHTVSTPSKVSLFYHVLCVLHVHVPHYPSPAHYDLSSPSYLRSLLCYTLPPPTSRFRFLLPLLLPFSLALTHLPYPYPSPFP